MIVGRDAELAAIDEWLAAARVPALLIEGDAGIGKSTLWRAGVTHAEARGYRVLACVASGAETQLAFTVLRDLLTPAFDGVADQLPEPQRRALAAALLREDPAGPASEPSATAVAVHGALRAMAAESPTIIAVDDAQWVDSASSQPLAYALRRLDREGVGALLARRVEQAPRPLGLEELSDEQLQVLGLAGLTVGALGHVLNERLGASYSRPTLHRLHEVSSGNPFFALELARALDGRALTAGDPLPVPASLSELTATRLAGLDPETREVLLYVAALAQATVDLVTIAAGAGARSAIEKAGAAGVVETEGSRLRFAHPLLASAHYASATDEERTRVHHRLAEVVTDTEERARHLALATDAPSAPVADLLEESARVARARGAPTAAAELAEQAVELTPDGQAEDELRRVIAAGGYYFEAGDAERARRLFEAAAQAAAPGPSRARALWRLARVHVYEADHRAAVTLYREALAEADDDLETRIEAEAGLAVAMMRMLEDLPTAARHARTAVELAKAHAVREVVAELEARRALVEALLGDLGALELASRAAELERAAAASGASVGDYLPFPQGGARFMFGVILQWADRLDESRAAFESAREGVLEVGDESSLPLIGRYLAAGAWLEGDWESAAREADDAYSIADQTGQTSQQGVLAGMRGLLLAHLGRVEEARAAAEDAERVSQETGAMFGTLLARSGLGLLELSLGNPAAADRHLAPLLERLDAAGVREPGTMRFVPDEIEALIVLERIDEAEGLLTRFEAQALVLDRPSALAAVGRCRGLLEAARGRPDDSLAFLDAALDQHGRVSIPFERARTLLVRGTIHRRMKQKRAARDSLEQAVAVFDRLGARLWADKARFELARIGGRAPAGDGLTPTERQVAELVARGFATKEVASTLFVSPKTVEGHLSRIYAKLGVRSRAELASVFAVGRSQMRDT